MRSVYVLCAFAALATAAPKPQNIDFDAIKSAPSPTVTGPPIDASAQTISPNLASASSIAAHPTTPSMDKRGVNDPCGIQPAGSGPVPTPDTAEAFLADTELQQASLNATTPDGFEVAFSNLQASVNGNIYLGLTTIASYDPETCAQLCNAKDGCQGFNIYFERDPSLNPADGCSDPPSVTDVKCTLWGGGVTEAMANNAGEDRVDFRVVIAGSNGYNITANPAPISGFDGPTKLGGAINAPMLNGTNTYQGVKFFRTSYDPSVCATACLAQTAYNQEHAMNGSYTACNFFVAYVSSVNDQVEGLYCALYSVPWDPSYATNEGQWQDGDWYSNTRAYSYTLSPQDEGESKLPGWKWIINSRGYANIVPSSDDVVYSLIYHLRPQDERALDGHEGVPDAYVKKTLQVDRLVEVGRTAGVPKRYIDREIRPYVPKPPGRPFNVGPRGTGVMACPTCDKVGATASGGK
ncbi:MAG: hypothetical protein M1838_003302 [Thelocarpon superellum]|nr:MAG: hypothetical protein M1838_003302 [Thelocarpon superellum]